MPPITSERLIEYVRKSGLVDESTLDQTMERVRAKCDGELPSSAKKLAEYLQRKELITAWHTEKLLAGKYKGFFLGKYKLLGHIGTGGMSSVYLAEHIRMADKRAIKVLPKKRVEDASYLARFQLEAKAIASLNHPNIVGAYDIDNEGDVHYIVMEYVDGLDLQALVKRDGPMDFGTAADLLAQAAEGLHHAHGKGVVHRDVKPANLLIDQDGRIRLLDMGLALVAAQDDESLTVANNENVLGTADYLAPEQALNSHTVDHRADIYGLGCTMYFLLTGKPPFSDGTLAQRIAKHQNQMPESIKKLRGDCPGELEGIVWKMIQKEPKYRYQSAKDVASALAKFAASVPKAEVVRAGAGGGSGSSVGPATSSITFDSGKRSGSSASGDTVTNKNDDTMASSRSKLVSKGGLSAGDSGRLVDIKQKVTPSDLLEGSFLDLEIESGYRGGSKIMEQLAGDASGDSQVASRGKKRAFDSGTHAAAKSGRSSSAARSGASSARPSRGQRRPQPAAKTGLNPKLVGFLGVILFAVALAIGYVLDKVLN